MEKIQWKVEGMDCSNCSITIHRYLEKQGMNNVKVNFATGDVIFDLNGTKTPEELAIGIKRLGYEVVSPKSHAALSGTRKFLSTHLHRFLFCLPFTIVLML